MDEFLSLEESQKIAERYPEINFEWSYYLLTSSNQQRIFPSDKILKGVEQHLYKKLGPAVPSNFNDSIKQVKEVVEVTENLTPEEQLKKKYDYISDKAWLYGADMFTENMFLDCRVCKELWIVTTKKREITGWAFYQKRLLEYTTRKIAEVIELRPLVDPSYKNNIFEYVLICPAVTKQAYPELDVKELSPYAVSKLPDISVRATIQKILSGKKVYEVMKIKFVSANGVKKELNVFFFPELRGMVTSISKELETVNVTFHLEEYLEHVDGRYILEESRIQPLFEAIECLRGNMKGEPNLGISYFSNEKKPEKINIFGNGTS